MTGLLLDTNILLPLLEPHFRQPPRRQGEAVIDPQADLSVSVASLWEIAIKWRLGRLRLLMAPVELENAVAALEAPLLPVMAIHATSEVDPWPPTYDPFDRVLLATCLVEGVRLVTADRALIDHPLAYRPSA